MSIGRTTAQSFLLSLAALVPEVVNASNFGDLPSVVPVFFVGLAISLGWAIHKATRQDDDQGESRFSVAAFIVYFLIGATLSLVALIIAFAMSF